MIFILFFELKFSPLGCC